jgi:hypothetical protein
MFCTVECISWTGVQQVELQIATGQNYTSSYTNRPKIELFLLNNFRRWALVIFG